MGRTLSSGWSLVLVAATAFSVGCTGEIGLPYGQPAESGTTTTGAGTGSTGTTGTGSTGTTGTGTTGGPMLPPFAPAQPAFARLTVAQYSNVIRDLLGA